MSFVKIGDYIINEDDITAVSIERNGSIKDLVIRLRGSEAIAISMASDFYQDAKRFWERYLEKIDSERQKAD